MAKQDWSPKKSELFTTFATAINKKYEDKFDLNDEQIKKLAKKHYTGWLSFVISSAVEKSW